MRAKQSEKALMSASCHSNCWYQSPTICVLCKAAITHCILSDGQAIISKADNSLQGIFKKGRILNAAAAAFMVQDGCGFIHTKTTILLTSGPGMTRKLKNECRAWKCIILMLYKDKRMSSSNILLHSTNEQRLYLFAVMQCTCRL